MINIAGFLINTTIKIQINPDYYKWSSFAVSGILGITGSLLLYFNSHVWYASLVKPYVSLPLMVLAPFHIFSLIMAGLGAQIVMGNVSGNPGVKPARRLYSIWLSLHATWILFFAGFHFPVLSFGVALIQWAISVLCIQNFYNVDPKAGRRVTFFFALACYWLYMNGAILSYNNL